MSGYPGSPDEQRGLSIILFQPQDALLRRRMGRKEIDRWIVRRCMLACAVSRVKQRGGHVPNERQRAARGASAEIRRALDE